MILVSSDNVSLWPTGERQTQQPFAFVDFERSSALLVLLLVFGALVAFLCGWHGVRALVGLGISLVIVVEFLEPSILDGNPPLAVALVGSVAAVPEDRTRTCSSRGTVSNAPLGTRAAPAARAPAAARAAARDRAAGPRA
jgi:hypothetical protein